MNSSSEQNTVEFGSIRRELELAENPLSAAELSRLLKQKSGKAFQPTLNKAVSAGRIYRWGPNLYWDRNPRAMARERLLRVTVSELLSAAPLNKRLGSESPKINQKDVIEVRKELVREGSLREVAPHRGSKSKAKLIVNVSNPEQYLEFEIRRLLADFGIERSTERINALLAPQQQPKLEVQTGNTSDVGEIAETMFAAMNRIAFAPGTTVTFYRLRQQPELASVPKVVFDQAALLLQKDRKALLAIHDHAPRLPQSERDELVTDGLGNYYVSIYAL